MSEPHSSPLRYPARQRESVLCTVAPIRGRAVVELSAFLTTRQLENGSTYATALANDLLEHSSERFCENIVTLLRDGWVDSLGELFSCARRLG